MHVHIVPVNTDVIKSTLPFQITSNKLGFTQKFSIETPTTSLERAILQKFEIVAFFLFTKENSGNVLVNSPTDCRDGHDLHSPLMSLFTSDFSHSAGTFWIHMYSDIDCEFPFISCSIYVFLKLDLEFLCQYFSSFSSTLLDFWLKRFHLKIMIKPQLLSMTLTAFNQFDHFLLGTIFFLLSLGTLSHYCSLFFHAPLLNSPHLITLNVEVSKFLAFSFFIHFDF